MDRHPFIEIIHHQLIVSCKRSADRLSHDLGTIAQAVKKGGAKAILCHSAKDAVIILEQTKLPILGLVKEHYPSSEITITPTKKEIDDLLAVKPTVIIIDATTRIRPGGAQLEELIRYIHTVGEALVVGTVTTIKDAGFAVGCGVDLVFITQPEFPLDYSNSQSPDYELIKLLCRQSAVPVLVEGRIQSPEQAKRILDLGAWAIVVESAMLRPQKMVEAYVDAMGR